MTPRDLQTSDFASWPPEAQRLAARRIELLRRLPLSFLSILFREMIDYDWKFPLERGEIDRQLEYLQSLSPDEMQRTMQAFLELRLSPALERADWVNAPARFSEQFSAHLWATHQMDTFRRIATEYIAHLNTVSPEPQPLIPRLCIVLVGAGANGAAYLPFRKIRREGVLYRQVRAADTRKAALAVLDGRATAHPVPYGHWYVDGESCTGAPNSRLTCVSWEGLASLRDALRNRLRQGFESHTGPETMRTMLASARPQDLGLNGGDTVLNWFQLKLFTEGSGTQIFSTTFVQWAAREALRRARPLSMLVRFAPRARDYSMDELLSKNEQTLALDPEGALRDADMGAWYTLLNLRRLIGRERSSFLVCFEGHSQAVAVGPDFKPGTEAHNSVDLEELLNRLV